jgi:energy-coupling factor transporter ATP-binding protein EcfA2
MDNIKINSLGPIESADINFGDLTFFVGPQESGKSILLQMIKLLVDKEETSHTLRQYGYVWGNDTDAILDRYFGEGMAGIWNDKTKINLDGVTYDKNFLLSEENSEKLFITRETLFYIPAQRVVCLQNGWPRFFTDYEDSVPFVLRHFSETLRQFLESNTSMTNDVIFPKPEELSAPLVDSFNESIFHNGRIVLDQTVKKRFKLNIGNSSIPYMAWSAGQKEFMPLLLSFYWLCPPSKTGRLKGIRYVIVEEPEMGLHPQAIESVILQVIDLLSRGYKIIISTHSPVLLEFAWAFHYLKKIKNNNNLLAELFNLDKTPIVDKLFKDILKKKTINTYYFDREKEKVTIRDISSLDAGSDDISVSEWGGLSSFSSKASDIISKIMAQQR